MEPIDFVVMWVDGNDPEWQEQRKNYLPEVEKRKNLDLGIARERDWDNLRYWFRSVEEFAPWVRTIHFVTWNGKGPTWLNTNNPKLHMVKHSDFIDQQYLPLFNSCAIEINIHRIPGLAEQFVYFNDDMFLTKPVKPTIFFQDGIPTSKAVLRNVSDSSSLADQTIRADMDIINRFFNMRTVLRKNFFKWFNPIYGKAAIKNILLSSRKEFPGLQTQHVAAPFLKSTWATVWGKAEGELLNTLRHRFRTDSDIFHWLFIYWQIASGDFIPSRRLGVSFQFTNDSRKNKKILDIVTRQKYKMVCVNDSSDLKNFESLKSQLNRAFEKILPNFSSFENEITK